MGEEGERRQDEGRGVGIMEKPEEEKQNQEHQHLPCPPAWPRDPRLRLQLSGRAQDITGTTEERKGRLPVCSCRRQDTRGDTRIRPQLLR